MRQYSTKWNLVKPIAKIYSQGFHRNLLPNFLSFRLFSMQYRSLPNFLLFLNQKEIRKEKKKVEIVCGPDSVHGLARMARPNSQY
jgi:hypothetical protein